MMHGEVIRKRLIRFYGSVGLCSLGRRPGRWFPSSRLASSIPMASSSNEAPKTLWQMNKVQLLAEATRLGITTHPSWSTGEVRQLIADKRKESNETGMVPKGLASMTKDQLIEECAKLGITPPAGATKGHMQLLIRDSTTAGKGNSVVMFGRHQGKLVKEVPKAYLEWCIMEIAAKGKDGCGQDLVNLGSYAETVLHKKTTKAYNPEEDPLVPLPPDDASESSVWGSEWSALTSMAKSMNESVESRQRPFPPKAAPKQDPVENDRMHQEIPPQAKARGRGPDDTPGGTQRSVQFVEELDGSQSELEDDDSPDALEFEIQSPPIHVLPGARDEDVTSGETFYECQETAPRATCGETNEHRARDLLRRKDFSFSACEGLLEQVCKDCQASRKRKINEGTCSVAFGGYRHGCHYGVIKRTYQHWYMTKYVNEFMRFHGAQGQWSSLQLCFNCHIGPHKDAHNVGANWAISRLWLEHCDETEVPGDREPREAILTVPRLPVSWVTQDTRW